MKKFEMRKMDRYGLSLAVKIRIPNGNDPSSGEDMGFFLTKNVCAGGAFFETEHPLHLGTMIKAEFELSFGPPERSKRRSAITVFGTVVRMEEQAMAVQFTRKYQIAPV